MDGSIADTFNVTSLALAFITFIDDKITGSVDSGSKAFDDLLEQTSRYPVDVSDGSQMLQKCRNASHLK